MMSSDDDWGAERILAMMAVTQVVSDPDGAVRARRQRADVGGRRHLSEPQAAWFSSTRTGAGRPTSTTPQRRAIASGGWCWEQTALSGSEQTGAWRGSTMMDAGRPKQSARLYCLHNLGDIIAANIWVQIPTPHSHGDWTLRLAPFGLWQG
jgi:hypothetical protein